MKKRVDPEKATDPVSKALAAYQAQQDVMDPAGSSLHLDPSMNTMGRVDPPASKATTSYQIFGCIQEMCATPSTNGPLQIDAAAPALQFQHSSLHAWLESGPLSTMDLPNHPSFSPVGAASPSSQGLPGMTIPVSLSQLGSFFSTSSMPLVTVNSIHSTAPLNSRPAPTSGQSLAMMDTQPQTFESMKGGLSKQLHIDCKDAEQCHAQGEGLAGKQVLGHQDELSITANKAVSQYNNFGTCALTELDLETDRDVDASMESEIGGLFYEPPQFPCSSESPFLSYDLIQNCQSLQAYSPLGIRRMIVSMGNCITTPPYHLSESPFQGNSPQSRLRSAAQSFSGSPSILRKRARQLMIPAKQGSTGRKKDRQVGPSWTSPRIKEKKEITTGLLTCSVKTPDDTVQGNPTKDTVEWTARQATCQARTALFVSPSKHFGSVLNAQNVPQGLHPNSESNSQDYTNDRNGGVEYSSPPVYAQDCRQVATCSTGMCEAAGGKYIERRLHGISLEYQSQSSRWGDSEQAMKEGVVCAEQTKNGQGQLHFPVEANTLPMPLVVCKDNCGDSTVFGGKRRFGGLRASCEAGVVSSGTLISEAVLSEVPDEREMMSPGAMSTFAVTCASPGGAVLQGTPGNDWLAEFESINFASVMSDSSFASPTAIWGEHWRVDPFASAEKEISISFEEGSEVPVGGREVNALRIMESLNGDNVPGNCEAEEVFAKLPSAVCMASPHSQYRTQRDLGQSAHDCKENLKKVSTVDGETSSSFINWLMPFQVDRFSPECGIARTPVRVSTLGLNDGSGKTQVVSGGSCDRSSPSTYLLKGCR